MEGKEISRWRHRDGEEFRQITISIRLLGTEFDTFEVKKRTIRKEKYI